MGLGSLLCAPLQMHSRRIREDKQGTLSLLCLVAMAFPALCFCQNIMVTTYKNFSSKPCIHHLSIRHKITKAHPWLVVVIICCFQWNWILGIQRAIMLDSRQFSYGQ